MRNGRKLSVGTLREFFALFPIGLVALPAGWLFVAFLMAGLREVGEPARKARIVDLAAESHRGHSWPFVLGGVASAVGLLLYALSSRGSRD